MKSIGITVAKLDHVRSSSQKKLELRACVTIQTEVMSNFVGVIIGLLTTYRIGLRQAKSAILVANVNRGVFGTVLKTFVTDTNCHELEECIIKQKFHKAVNLFLPFFN